MRKKCSTETSHKPIFKKSKLSISEDKWSEVLLVSMTHFQHDFGEKYLPLYIL